MIESVGLESKFSQLGCSSKTALSASQYGNDSWRCNRGSSNFPMFRMDKSETSLLPVE